MQIARHWVLEGSVVAEHRLAVRIQLPKIGVCAEPVRITAALLLGADPWPRLQLDEEAMLGAQSEESADVEPRISAAVEVDVSRRRFVPAPAQIGRHERDFLRRHLCQKGVPVIRVVAPEMNLPAQERNMAVPNRQTTVANANRSSHSTPCPIPWPGHSPTSAE